MSWLSDGRPTSSCGGPPLNADGEPPSGSSDGSELQSTAVLLTRVRKGDLAARDHLLARYGPMLERWAHRRLPREARELLDTSDLVQMTLVRSLKVMEGFESQHEGAFLAYLRKMLLNLIRDEVRRVRRKPGRAELVEEIIDSAPSPLEDAIGSDLMRRYEDALGRLTPAQQEALLMKIEFGCTPEEIATVTGRPTASAARVFVARAMIRLAEEMGTDA